MYHLEGSAVGVRMRREMDDGSRGCLLQAIWVRPQLGNVLKERTQLRMDEGQREVEQQEQTLWQCSSCTKRNREES